MKTKNIEIKLIFKRNREQIRFWLTRKCKTKIISVQKAKAKVSKSNMTVYPYRQMNINH